MSNVVVVLQIAFDRGARLVEARQAEVIGHYMTLTDENILDLVMVFTGVLLLFRRVAQMERHHTLRVFLVTAVLSIGVICFFLIFGFTLGNPPPLRDPCDISPQQFCLTE